MWYCYCFDVLVFICIGRIMTAEKKVIREKPVLVPHELPWDIYNLDECQSSKCSTLFEGEVHRTVYFMCYIISCARFLCS